MIYFDDMTTLLRFKCLECRHYYGQLKCLAYPDRIPEDIVFGKDKHLQVRDDQDNEIVYEKDTEQ